VPDSLRGHLLIAAPSLFDYFRRTVVLVIEHTSEGAIGVVLGRETETRVADAVPALADLPGADDVVYLGGPVAPESVVALGDFEQPEEAGTRLVGSLGTLDPDGANDSLRRLRVFAGYAGWGPGQLDGELEEEAWFGAPFRREDAFTDEPDELWSRALLRKGGAYALVARMPLDPSLN
jgi:putative transcriptional regulator